MANEIHYEDPSVIGSTLYVILWNEAGQAWNGTAFAAWTGVHADFDIAAADAGGVGYFLATMPAVAAGNYRWKWFTGGIELASGSDYWNGTVFGDAGIPAAVLAAAVPASNAANTVGDCLNTSRAQAVGKWTLNATTREMTLYSSDGVTEVGSFVIGPNLSAPLTRTPQ